MQYFVIGEREIVLAFALAGVSGAVATNREEALDAFFRVTGKGGTLSAPVASQKSGRPKVLILTEEVSMLLKDETLEWQRSGGFPLIVEIPPLSGHIKGKKSLTEQIREAVGIQI